MIPYRIKVYPVYCWAEFEGWAWEVYSPTGEKLTSGQAVWRWLAARRAQKWVNKLHKGDTSIAVKDRSNYMDYDWYPDMREGFAREQ